MNYYLNKIQMNLLGTQTFVALLYCVALILELVATFYKNLLMANKNINRKEKQKSKSKK